MNEPFDPLESDLIEETLRSPGYSLIAKRIQEEIARRVRALIDSAVDGDKTRGMIQGLELALAIPRIVAEETRPRKKNQ